MVNLGALWKGRGIGVWAGRRRSVGGGRVVFQAGRVASGGMRGCGRMAPREAGAMICSRSLAKTPPLGLWAGWECMPCGVQGVSGPHACPLSTARIRVRGAGGDGDLCAVGRQPAPSRKGRTRDGPPRPSLSSLLGRQAGAARRPSPRDSWAGSGGCSGPCRPRQWRGGGRARGAVVRWAARPCRPCRARRTALRNSAVVVAVVTTATAKPESRV